MDTLACLDSLTNLDCCDLHITVVDNGSSDNSIAQIRDKFPRVEILQTGKNLGYAGGNNVGIRHALAEAADFICILNNDVVVEPNFLAPLLASLEVDPEAGIATPLIVDGDNLGHAWALGATIDWSNGSMERLFAGRAVEELTALHPFEVGIAPGSAMLIKRDVFERVGVLDERYFLYFEEADWCIGVQEAGYKIIAVPESVVVHGVSATLGQSSPFTDYYMTRNRFLFIRRHTNGTQRTRLAAKTYFREAITIVVYTIKTNHGQRLPHRTARLYALRDSLLGRWGKMGDDTATVCYPKERRT